MPPPVPPAPRGRPPKDAAPSKRPRGRPRKNPEEITLRLTVTHRRDDVERNTFSLQGTRVYLEGKDRDETGEQSLETRDGRTDSGTRDGRTGSAGCRALTCGQTGEPVFIGWNLT